MGEARRRAAQGLPPRKPQKNSKAVDTSPRVVSWLPLTKNQTQQFVAVTTRGAWFGIGAMVLREIPSLRSLAGIAVSCLGVAWLISQGQMGRLAALTFTTGDLWILTSSIVWAVYSLFLRFRPADLDPVAFLGVSASIGCAVLWCLGAWNPFNEAPMQFTPRLMSAVAFFAVFPSLLAYLCWNAGMARVGAARGGQMIHLMPVFGLALATWVLDETMAAHHWVGAVLIASGLLIALLPVHRWRPARA